MTKKKDIQKAVTEIRKITVDLDIPITDIDGNILENIEINKKVDYNEYER